MKVIQETRRVHSKCANDNMTMFLSSSSL